MFKHLDKDDPEPKFDQGKLLFYTFQFSPYCRRVALTLSYHSIEHKAIYVNIKNKPDWFLHINPTGKVPMIEQDGQRLLESEMICRYLDQLSLSNHLVNCNAENSIKWANNWWENAFNAFYTIAYTDLSSDQDIKDFFKSLSDFENVSGTTFLNGDKIELADFLVYPLMELVNICLSRIHYPPINENVNFPRINSWFASMKGVTAVQKEHISDELYEDFIINFLKIPFKN